MVTLRLLYPCFFQFPLHFPSLFIKSIQLFKCIMQNSWQNFLFSQNLKFFKISPWNLIFSCKSKLSPLCMNEKKWIKCWVVYVCYRIILEQCALRLRNKLLEPRTSSLSTLVLSYDSLPFWVVPRNFRHTGARQAVVGNYKIVKDSAR